MARTRSSIERPTLDRWRREANEVSGRAVAAGLLARIERDGMAGLDEGQLVVAWREAVRTDDPIAAGELAGELERQGITDEWRERGIPLAEWHRRHPYRRQAKEDR